MKIMNMCGCETGTIKTVDACKCETKTKAIVDVKPRLLKLWIWEYYYTKMMQSGQTDTAEIEF